MFFLRAQAKIKKSGCNIFRLNVEVQPEDGSTCTSRNTSLKVMISFIQYSVWRQVQNGSMFQSFSCDFPSALCKACMTLPLETPPPPPPPPGEPNGGVVCLRIKILSPEEASRIYDISVYGKRLSRKNETVVVCPCSFHIAVQQPFTPLWSRLLLYELEPSRASFALCFKSLLMTLLPALVLVSLFVWHLSFDLSSKGDPASSYATAGIALRVTGILKPLTTIRWSTNEEGSLTF
jgi:hypothetical protein